MPDISSAWLSDDPLGALDEEAQFKRAHLVDHTLVILKRLRQQSESSTIGLVGTWGAGKTTVLTELARRISDPSAMRETLGEEWAVGHFSPWLYSDPASLHAAFFAELKGALPKERRWKERRRAVATSGRRLTPLIAAGQILGYNAVNTYDGLLDQLEPSTTERQRTAAEAMRALGTPILMIVDDLDRLSADELLQVFKLVRVLGRLPNVYYVLSYDERSLIDLLSKTDLVADDQGRRALDYLEKMIQVRLDMPLLRDYEVDRAINQSLSKIVRDHQVGLEPAQLSRLADRFGKIMSSRLRTPRALKRMFGQLDAFLPAVGREVDFEDFVVVTWLRTVEPGVYGMLQSYRGELLGGGGDPLRALRRPKQTDKDRRVEWERRLAAAHVADEHIDDVLYLLTTLFPRLRGVYEGKDTDSTRERNMPTVGVGKIAHFDYFDRYFQFGVPDDDIADATVRQAILALASNRASVARSAMERTFSTQPDLVLRKMHDLSSEVGVDRRGVVLWLGDRYLEFDPLDFMAHSIVSLIAEILSLGTPETANEFVGAQLGTDERLYLAASVHRSLAQVQIGSAATIEASHELADSISPSIRASLDARFMRVLNDLDSPLDATSILDYAFWMWRELDRDRVKEYLQNARESGRWSLLDEIAWFVSYSTNDRGSFISRFSDFGSADGLLDIDLAYRELRDEIAAAPSVESLHDSLATPDNRRLFVLASLRRAQMQQARDS